MPYYLPKADVSGYMSQFRDFAESQVLGSFTPMKEDLPFGTGDYANAMREFYTNTARQVWSALPPEIRNNVIAELGDLAFQFVKQVAEDLTEAVADLINSIADAIPFIGAIVKFAVFLIKQMVQAGKNHADMLDRDRTRVRWIFERELYLKSQSLGLVFADTTPRYTPRSIVGTKMKTHDLYKKVGAWWLPSRTATHHEWTPMFYPWVTPRMKDGKLEPLAAAAACTKDGQAPMLNEEYLALKGAPEGFQKMALCVGKPASKPPSNLGLEEWPWVFDRNSEPSTIQAMLIQDPAANLAVPTSHLKAFQDRLRNLKPGVYKGSRGGAFEVSQDHIDTAVTGLVGFVKAREGFLRDPNACARAVDASKTKPRVSAIARKSGIDPAVAPLVQANAKQAPILMSVNMDAIKDVQFDQGSSAAIPLLFGAALFAGGVYLRSKRSK